jgi:putative oxidoreductase
MFDRLSAYAPQALAVLRIVAALLFLAHGTQKLMGFPAAEFAPPAFSIFWFAGVIEIITGIMIGIGFFTRPAAFIASGTMAFAYWMAHFPADFFPGPGAWSVNKQ